MTIKANKAANTVKTGRAVRKPKASPAVVADAGIADEMALLAASLAGDGIDASAVLADADKAILQADEGQPQADSEAKADEGQPAAPEALPVQPQASPAASFDLMKAISLKASAEFMNRSNAAAQATTLVSSRSVSTPAGHAAVLAQFEKITPKASALLSAAAVTVANFQAFATGCERHGKAATRSTFMLLAGEAGSTSAMSDCIIGALQRVKNAKSGEAVLIANDHWPTFGSNKAQCARFGSAAKGMFVAFGAAQRIGTKAISIDTAHAGIQAMLAAAQERRLVI